MGRTRFRPEQSPLVCQVIMRRWSGTTHLNPLHSSNLPSIPWVYTDWLVDHAVQTSCGAILSMGSAADSV
jgi:hypothetical protein